MSGKLEHERGAAILFEEEGHLSISMLEEEVYLSISMLEEEVYLSISMLQEEVYLSTFTLQEETDGEVNDIIVANQCLARSYH